MASSTEIQRQIKYYKSLRSGCYTKIEELESDENDLEDLKKKYDDLQETFEEYQNNRKKALSKLKNVSKIKSINKYYSGMKELLNGTEYLYADDGLTDAISIINEKIDNMGESIEEYNLDIRRYDGIIEGLEKDYKLALQTEAEST